MRPLKVLAAVAIIAIAGAAATFVQRSADPIRTGTASVSHSLCAAAFISQIDPDVVYAQEERPEGGMSLIDWALHYNVDRVRREVRTTVLGGFAGRAVYRDGLGCLVVQEDGAPSAAAAHELTVSAPPAESRPAAASRPAFEKALDQAFAEPDPSHMRWTKAVVAMQDGQIIAERYAPGYGADTRIWGHSLSKSVTNALVAILVRKGALRTDQTVPDWRPAADSRRSVTINQLLRMTTGLPFDETGAPNDPTIHMLFLERDMAAYAERTPLAYEPGTHWGYSNLGYMILSRLVRDTVGGTAASVEQFARSELFEPLHMASAVLECDATGTPLGAGGVYASARDWARFGQLYLEDGVADGQRILPEGWVRYSASQTLQTGYGAGFWTNLVNEGSVPVWDAPWGMPQVPKDMFYARGYLGQFIVIVPSERLVVARLGLTHNGGTGTGTLVADIISALHAAPTASR